MHRGFRRNKATAPTSFLREGRNLENELIVENRATSTRRRSAARVIRVLRLPVPPSLRFWRNRATGADVPGPRDRNQLLPISTSRSAKVGQARLWSRPLFLPSSLHE